MYVKVHVPTAPAKVQAGVGVGVPSTIKAMDPLGGIVCRLDSVATKLTAVEPYGAMTAASERTGVALLTVSVPAVDVVGGEFG